VPRGLQRLATDPRVPWLLALLALAFGVPAALGDHYLGDEGLLSWCFAAMLREEPLAVFFWLKSRPPLALLQAPFADLGARAHAVMHVLLGAFALPMLAAVARAAGQRSPNLAPTLLLLSPLWLACGPAAVSNSDALTGLVLVLYLWRVRGRPAVAGALLGALVLIRAELVIVAVGLALVALVAKRGSPDRARSLALAAPLLPALYALAGALYHGDLLWPLRYPPALAAPPAVGLFHAHGYAGSLGDAALALLALCPFIVLFPGLRASRLPPFERLAALLVLLYLLAIRGLPALGLFNFDSSPRYLLPCLPLLALALARGLEGWPQGQDHGRSATLALAAALLTGHHIAQSGGGPALLLAVAAAALALLLVRAGPRLARLALPGLLLGAALALPALLPATRLQLRPELPRIEAHLLATPELQSDRIIVTNIAVLGLRLARRGLRPPDLFLLHLDQVHEIDALTAAANGQRRAIWSALQRRFYAPPLRPADVDRQLSGRRVLFILADDPRLPGALPPARWWPRLTERWSAGSTFIATYDPQQPPSP
jgi:hypothetical protein